MLWMAWPRLGSLLSSPCMFFFFIMFLKVRRVYIVKKILKKNPKKVVLSIHQKPKNLPKRERGINKKITCPHLELSQSMKLTREHEHITTYTLNQTTSYKQKNFHPLDRKLHHIKC